MRARTSRLLDFLRTEEASSILLLAAAMVALLWVNSPFVASYESLWGTLATLDIGSLSIEHDLQQWVNEGLMTLFFLVVGLEIKREITVGELREPKKLALPAIAAVGGMVVPAAIYLALNADGPTAGGWGTPVATDIAFALGVLTIVASRAPVSVRSFLLTLAIVDDIGAVVLIAVFYSGGIEIGWLLTAGVVTSVMALVRFLPGLRLGPYVALGVALWLALYEAGVHPTIAGVIIGLLIPSSPSRRFSLASAWQHVDEAMRRRGDEGAAYWTAVADQSRDAIAPLDRAQGALHPWTSRCVVPTFALANAGVSIDGALVAETFTSPVGLGVLLGLVVGKPVGILAAVWVAIRTGAGELPAGITRRVVLGIAALAGIGFTVSLFIADLAFRQPTLDTAKVGVLGASLIASVTGAVILRRSGPRQAPGGDGIEPPTEPSDLPERLRVGTSGERQRNGVRSVGVSREVWSAGPVGRAASGLQPSGGWRSRCSSGRYWRWSTPWCHQWSKTQIR